MEFANVKSHSGLETDIPTEMELTAKSVVILYNLEQKGCVVWEHNPSDKQDLDTCDQIEEIAGNVGYYFLKTESNMFFLISRDEFQIV